MDIQQLRAEVISFRDQRNWGALNTAKDLAIALSIEAAELNELFLWKTDAQVGEMLGDRLVRERLADEMADVFIYLLALSDRTEIDLAESVSLKLQKNALKYPV